TLTRSEVLTNAAEIARTGDLTVSGDLADGFGADPGTKAETILFAAEVGMIGGSIDDDTGDPAATIYAARHGVKRDTAPTPAAKSLSGSGLLPPQPRDCRFCLRRGRKITYAGDRI